jgi:sterol desaturase/sphingolipid hydroxylase (fatty acid hydroxylase superfamily)
MTPVWLSIHFYATHRLLHWQPLYKSVHYLHHKNVNINPWSGLAMHPVEHLVLFSAVIPFWFIPSHPLHTIYLLMTFALGPSTGHLGFDAIVLRRNRRLRVGDYMHYLHHKCVSVNFGGGAVPLDKWLGTFHDGTDESTEALRRRARLGRRSLLRGHSRTGAVGIFRALTSR